jgi:hypothetical protein
MEVLYRRIETLLQGITQIPLQNGNFYRYLGPVTTTINGNRFPAFLYEISPNNQKRVSINLIHSMYEQTLRTGTIPPRAEIFVLFPFELCSRPCNYTVSEFIVEQLILDDLRIQKY